MIEPNKETVGVIGAAVATALASIMWISRLMRSWAGDRSAEQQDKSSAALLTHYEERVETLAKKCDELASQNATLMTENAKLMTQMEQLRAQLSTFGALLDYYLRADESTANTPPADLMKKLACLIHVNGQPNMALCGGGK